MTMAQTSLVLSPEQQEQVAVALEEDAQVMSDTMLTEQLASHQQQSRRKSCASIPRPGISHCKWR